VIFIILKTLGVFDNHLSEMDESSFKKIAYKVFFQKNYFDFFFLKESERALYQINFNI
jgi:hypothetical protein